MSAKEKTTVDTFKPSDDALTERVLRARAEGLESRLRMATAGWSTPRPASRWVPIP